MEICVKGPVNFPASGRLQCIPLWYALLPTFQTKCFFKTRQFYFWVSHQQWWSIRLVSIIWYYSFFYIINIKKLTGIWNENLFFVFKKLRPKIWISNTRKIPMFKEDAVLYCRATWCILVAIPTQDNLASLTIAELKNTILKCHFISMMDRVIHLWDKRKFYFVSALSQYQKLMIAICEYSTKTTCGHKYDILYTAYMIYDIP